MIKAHPQEGKSALKIALECAYELLLQKIISNPNDMMGILLFGTVPHQPNANLIVKGKDERGRELFSFVQSNGLGHSRCKGHKRTQTSYKGSLTVQTFPYNR